MTLVIGWPFLVWCVLMCAMVTFTSPARAQHAFVPPDIVGGSQRAHGVQLEFEGRLTTLDSPQVRETHRRSCERVQGQAYVNTAAPDVDGRFRETRVQVNDRSYAWRVVQRVKHERGTMCRWLQTVEHRLHIARFDGRRTHTSTYDYESRTVRHQDLAGDQTAIGSQLPDLQRNGNVTSLPRVGVRLLAGLLCTEYRVMQSPENQRFHHTLCVTEARPLAGRTLPLVLARHMGDERNPVLQVQAVSVRPGVEVNLAIFEGPRGFRNDTQEAR